MQSTFKTVLILSFLLNAIAQAGEVAPDTLPLSRLRGEDLIQLRHGIVIPAAAEHVVFRKDLYVSPQPMGRREYDECILTVFQDLSPRILNERTLHVWQFFTAMHKTQLRFFNDPEVIRMDCARYTDEPFPRDPYMRVLKAYNPTVRTIKHVFGEATEVILSGSPNR